MACFLIGSLVIIAADDGATIAAAALVAVPENFHQVAWHGTLPHVERAPLFIGQVALIGCFLVAVGLGSTIGRETVACPQFVNKYGQPRPVGISTSPETHAIVLSNPIGVECIGNAHARLHVHPSLTLDFMLGVPDEQCLDEHPVGSAGAKRWLCLHRVKMRPLVVNGHLIGFVQATPRGFWKQVIGAATRIVASTIGKRVNGSQYCMLPFLVDLVAR